MSSGYTFTFQMVPDESEYDPIVKYFLEDNDNNYFENGHIWSDFFKDLVELHHPEILGELHFDPEWGMCEMLCEDRHAFAVFIQLLDDTLKDPERYLLPIVEDGKGAIGNPYEEFTDEELKEYIEEPWKSILHESPAESFIQELGKFLEDKDETLEEMTNHQRISFLMSVLRPQLPAPYDTEAKRRGLGWKLLLRWSAWIESLEAQGRLDEVTKEDWLTLARECYAILARDVPKAVHQAE